MPNKTRTILAVLLASATIANADTIIRDLTPGGFRFENGTPRPVTEFFNAYQRELINLAGARLDPNGGVEWSPFTIFGPENFDIVSQQPNANVGWTLTNTSGYHVSYIFIESAIGLYHLYGIGGDGITGAGMVTLDGLTSIAAITFAGSNVIGVPDNGITILMFLTAATLLVVIRKYATH